MNLEHAQPVAGAGPGVDILALRPDSPRLFRFTPVDGNRFGMIGLAKNRN